MACSLRAPSASPSTQTESIFRFHDGVLTPVASDVKNPVGPAKQVHDIYYHSVVVSVALNVGEQSLTLDRLSIFIDRLPATRNGVASGSCISHNDYKHQWFTSTAAGVLQKH